MDDCPYENQPGFHIPPDPGNLEYRNEPSKPIITILFSKNNRPAGGGASFCTNLWGSPLTESKPLIILQLLSKPRNSRERKTLEAIKENNLELERILASLKFQEQKQ